MHTALNINTYRKDGFVKICTVEESDDKWFYYDTNDELLFSKHNSWVYFIVKDEEIVKVGETGNPLGIHTYLARHEVCEVVANSKSRFGRLRTGDGTDEAIRKKLKEELAENPDSEVTLWAKKCDKLSTVTKIANKKVVATASLHKELELKYLDHFVKETGSFPRLNKQRK
jgi:hypothetical protein